MRHGPLFRQGRVTIGVIVHGDSTVSGHGPGMTPLIEQDRRLRSGRAVMTTARAPLRLPSAMSAEPPRTLRE